MAADAADTEQGDAADSSAQTLSNENTEIT